TEATTASASEDINYMTDIYPELIKSYYDFVANYNPHSEDLTINEGFNGVKESILGRTNEEALESLGFTVEDLNNDGIDELVIGSLESDEDANYANQIYALYTCVDNKPVLVFEGWARNRHYFISSDTYYYEGSNGAMYSIFGSAKFAPGDTELSDYDYYFTYDDPTGFSDMLFYHNNNGVFDPSESTLLDTSDDDFWCNRDYFVDQLINYDLAPLTQYYIYTKTAAPEPVDVPAEEHTECAITISTPSQELLDSNEGFVYFEDDDSEYASYVMFSCSEELSFFSYDALELFGTDLEDGLSYIECLYTAEPFTPDQPLIVRVEFFDTPHNGFSYTDKNGRLRHFILTMSGEDGSIIASEY
ncbi:MAG: hypothetical protein K6F97_00130, partial [Lachnospiraceae bacterium]|nr:hypothetical protein [Lachnospiraceae bacterium]